MTDMQAPRIAVITGAARGIGAAIAKTLAGTGNPVAILDLPSADPSETLDVIRSAGGTAEFFGVDVTDPLAVATAAGAVNERLGAPTILVNNAGITRDNLLYKLTESDWDAVIGVHLRGTFLVTRAFESGMRTAGWGRIVNMSSTSADGNRGQANYSAAKAGIIGFTKTMTLELGRFGITANAVAPGFIDTDMLRNTAVRLGISFEEFTADAVERIPVRYVGSADDVAATVRFLVSDAARYISGETIHVAGGFHE